MSSISQLLVERISDGRITVVFPDSKANNHFSQIRSDQDSKLKVVSFLEQGGKFLYTLEMNPKEVRGIEDFAVRGGLETIRNRIDQFGVSEPVVAPQGKNQILVQLPGIKDHQRAIELIGRTAMLEFKLVGDDHNLEDALSL